MAVSSFPSIEVSAVLRRARARSRSSPTWRPSPAISPAPPPPGRRSCCRSSPPADGSSASLTSTATGPTPSGKRTRANSPRSSPPPSAGSDGGRGAARELPLRRRGFRGRGAARRCDRLPLQPVPPDLGPCLGGVPRAPRAIPSPRRRPAPLVPLLFRGRSRFLPGLRRLALLAAGRRGRNLRRGRRARSTHRVDAGRALAPGGCRRLLQPRRPAPATRRRHPRKARLRLPLRCLRLRVAGSGRGDHCLPLHPVPQAFRPLLGLLRRGREPPRLAPPRRAEGVRDSGRGTSRLLFGLRVEPVVPLRRRRVLGRGRLRYRAS